MIDKLIVRFDSRVNKPIYFKDDLLIYEYNALSSFVRIHLPSRFHDFLAIPKLDGYFINYYSRLEGLNTYVKLSNELREKSLIEFSVFRRHLESCIELAKYDSSEEAKDWVHIWTTFLENDDFELFASESGVSLIWGVDLNSKFNSISSDQAILQYFGISAFEDIRHERDFKVLSKEKKFIEPLVAKDIDEKSFPSISENVGQSNEAIESIVLPTISSSTSKGTHPRSDPQKKRSDSSNIQYRIQRKRRNSKWIFSLLLIAFLVGMVFWFLSTRHSWDRLNGFIPDTMERYVQPITTWEPIEDPKTGGKYARGILNIALIDQTPQITKANFLEFVSELRPFCEEKNITVNYLDTTICLIQLTFSEESRSDYKESLRNSFAKYPILLWDESLFQISRTTKDDVFLDSRMVGYEKNVYERIECTRAWDVTMGSQDIVVAVIDNGFDLNHPELSGKSIGGYNVRTGTDDVFPHQGQAHGTHVAGIILANANNNTGIAGVAPECKLLPIKIGSDSDSFYSSEIIGGVLYAANHGASVINMSLGGCYNLPPNSVDKQRLNELVNSMRADEATFWKELFRLLDERNITVVLAAGNESLPIGIDPMSRSDKTIKVMALNQENQIASFSNFVYDGRFGLTIAAPGKGIVSCTPNFEFEAMDGTSMAAPFVSGAVALIKSKEPNIDNADVIRRLRTSQNYISIQSFQVPVLNVFLSLK